MCIPGVDTISSDKKNIRDYNDSLLTYLLRTKNTVVMIPPGPEFPARTMITRKHGNANALQLEATRATPALSRFNYDAMPSLTALNLSIAIL